MAYYPNFDCANFCYWMLNLSWQRLSGPQTVLVNTVYNASLAQTSVTDQQWKDFTMVSSWRSKYYESWGKYSSYYNTLCQNWLNNLPSTPSAWYTSIVNQFFQDLIDAGIDTELDRLWLFTGASEGISLVSLINPTSSPASNGLSTPFTPYQGYKGNGSSYRIDTNFVPNVNGVNFTLNSASFGAYARFAETSANAGVLMGTNSGTSAMWIQPRLTGDYYRSYLNTNSNYPLTTYTTTKGLFSVIRTSSAGFSQYKDGSLQGSAVAGSIALAGSGVSVLAGGTSNYSTNQASLAFIGSGSINQADFYNIIQTFMTRVGCQV